MILLFITVSKNSKISKKLCVFETKSHKWNEPLCLLTNIKIDTYFQNTQKKYKKVKEKNILTKLLLNPSLKETR